MINPISYPTVNDFPPAVQEALEIKGISTTMSEIQNSYEESKQQTDEIYEQIWSS